jgi:hypothetical protein
MGFAPSLQPESEHHQERPEYERIGADPEGDHQRTRERRNHEENPEHQGRNTAQRK